MKRRLRFGSLGHNFSWTMVGQGADALSKASLLVLIAKVGTPTMLGQFALGLGITAPVILFTNLQLAAVQATDARSQYRFADYLGLRMIGCAAAILIVTAICVVAEMSNGTRAVVLAVVAGKVFEALSDVYLGFFQQHEQMNQVARSQILRGLVTPCALAGGILAFGGLLPGVMAIAAVGALVFLLNDRPRGQQLVARVEREAGLSARLSPRFRSSSLRSMILLALPLGVVSLFDSLTTNVPRYFLQQHGGEQMVGYFSALAYLMVIGGLVVTSLSYSFRPRLARYFLDDHVRFRALLGRLTQLGTALGVAGVAGAYLLGGQVLALLYSPDYSAYADSFVWLMVGAAFWYIATCVSIGITSARIFWVQPLILGATLAASTLVCWLVIPTRGVLGAALAVTAGMAVRLVLVLACYFLVVAPRIRSLRTALADG